MAPATRSRQKTNQARSPEDRNNQVPTPFDAPERDRDAMSTHQRRSPKRARGSDAPNRNKRAKRSNRDVGQTSSLGEQSPSSAASREEGAAPNPSATPDATDDTRTRELLNSLSSRANLAVEADHTSPTWPSFAEGTHTPETSGSREPSPSQHTGTSENSTSVQPPAAAPGATSPATQHVKDIYEYDGSSDDDSNIDFKVLPDIGEDNSLSLEAAFNRDVVNFGDGAAVQPKGCVFFGPSSSPTTVSLDPKPFLNLFRQMKRKAWKGVKQDRDTQPNQPRNPETSIGKVLSRFARKIEQLYMMGSKQPDTAAQTAFFNEHTGLLRYYFGIVRKCVDFIKDKRLPRDKTVPSNKAPDKRKEMAKDLADSLIPWLVRLLNGAWHLGSPDSFDAFCIQLMQDTVGWIRMLFNTLQWETKDNPIPEKKRKSKKKEKSTVEKLEDEWRKWAKFLEARDQLDAPLRQVEVLLKKGPDMLAAEEEKQARLEADRKRLRELEAQKVEQDRLEKEQQEKERMLQNQNVSRSLRREADDGWIEAEVDYLREQLLGATYDDPKFPSLQDTARRVGHSVEDTMEKSRKELRRMLGRMWGDVRSPRQIEAEVKKLMQRWRLRYP